jgi:hypothetical protein
MGTVDASTKWAIVETAFKRHSICPIMFGEVCGTYKILIIGLVNWLIYLSFRSDHSNCLEVFRVPTNGIAATGVGVATRTTSASHTTTPYPGIICEIRLPYFPT